ncbi:MAG: protein translocase subunit SecD [Alphaproteobacteria bacterium]
MNEYSLPKKIIIALVVVLGFITALPNAIKLPEPMPSQTVKLGLDLQGGAHLLLQVDRKSVLKDFYADLGDTVRQTLRKEKIKYKTIKGEDDKLVVVLRDSSKSEQARKFTRFLVANINATTNGNTIEYSLTDGGVDKKLIDVVAQTIEIIRRRIDATGTQEPLIQRQGVDRIVVQLPGEKNPEKIKSLLGKTAKLSFHVEDTSGVVGANSFLTEDESGNDIVLKSRAYVTGENLTDAQASYSENRPVVSFRFDTAGARKFGRLTSKNVGKRIAILLDGKVISSPVVNEPIMGGSGIISGNFEVEEVNELSILLRAGALPAPLDVVEERTVGAGLGADSINAGKIAIILALVFVVIFMIIAYRRFGFYAVVSLTVNVVLILAVLTLLQATLTLPGIAGIVLTIGMAVDANVLIFERIREEYNNGAKVDTALERGFSSAFVTIVDANTTGLIAGVILYVFGTGPVQGFAVTLSIGIITSMFCAIMITKWLLITWVRRKMPSALPKGF